MFKLYVICFMTLFYTSQAFSQTIAVIGAGPAGISAVATLLDNNFPAQSIIWIDPEFSVGRLGKYYSTIPSNTKIRGIVTFLNKSHFFATRQQPSFMIHSLNPQKTSLLKFVIEPLTWCSTQLQEVVPWVANTVTSISQNTTDLTLLCSNGNTLTVDTIILATGSEPNLLDIETSTPILPLDNALSSHYLARTITSLDTVGVFGSSHSAILILKYLSEIPVKKIINFYKNPLIYATPMGSWTMHNSTGLKEETAWWAKNILEKRPPHNLERYLNTPQNLKTYLPQCTKIIAAIGYKPTPINGIDITQYNPNTGLLAPNIYGIGIAFPYRSKDPLGNKEIHVGVLDFLEQAERIIPKLIKRPIQL